MRINNDNNINFGFNISTHRKLANSVVSKEFPVLEKYLPVITEAVQKPDFDEIGLKCNTHFYYPKEKSFFNISKSFLDFFGKQNAIYKYHKHIDNMFEALSYSRYGDMVEQAARAKHFLDDVCVGLHVKKGSALSKYREMGLHKAFEDFIYENDDKLIKNSLDRNSTERFNYFDDVFINAVKETQKIELPSNNNKENWFNIAQQSMNNAVDSSREFFRILSDLLG